MRLALVCAASGCAGSGLGLDNNGDPIVDLATTDDGGGSGDGGYAVAFRDLQSKIFTPTCSKCHSGAAAPQGLQLDAANAWSTLVKVQSHEVPSLMRVAPGQPDSSYVMVKLVAKDPRRSGERMPRNGPPYLSDAQIKLVRTWIAEGAPK